jgi:membrane protein required for colicin V production
VSWLDIVLLVVAAWSVVIALARGFSREVIGLIAAVAGFLGGLWFYGPAGAFLEPYVSSPAIAHLCGFLIVFFGVILLGALLGYLLGKMIKWAGLSWFDRLLGAGFGLVRAVVIAIALVMAITAFTPGNDPPQAVVHSRLAPYVIDTAHVLSGLAPLELEQEFQKRYAQIKKTWNSAMRRRTGNLPGSEI